MVNSDTLNSIMTLYVRETDYLSGLERVLDIVFGRELKPYAETNQSCIPFPGCLFNLHDNVYPGYKRQSDNYRIFSDHYYRE